MNEVTSILVIILVHSFFAEKSGKIYDIFLIKVCNSFFFLVPKYRKPLFSIIAIYTNTLSGKRFRFPGFD